MRRIREAEALGPFAHLGNVLGEAERIAYTDAHALEGYSGC